jgi:hypothetical protein
MQTDLGSTAFLIELLYRGAATQTFSRLAAF